MSTTLAFSAGKAVAPSAVTTTAPRPPRVAITVRAPLLPQLFAGRDDRADGARRLDACARGLRQLDLVQHGDIDQLQQARRVGNHGRQVEHRVCARVARRGQHGLRRGDRRLELRHPDLVAPRHVADHGAGEVVVGAAGDGDGVVAFDDLDHGDAGGLPFDHADAEAVDVFVGQERAQGVAEAIVADRAQHGGRHTEPRRRDGLVEALAAGQQRHLGAEQRLARGGAPCALHDDVHVEAAADDDPAHQGRLISSRAGCGSFFSRRNAGLKSLD